MAFSCEFDEDRRLIIVRFRGDVSFGDLTGATEAGLSDCRHASFRALSDFSDVETWGLTSSDMRELADFHLSRQPTIELERSALVAPEPHIFGDLRVWEMTTDRLPFERRVFRDMKAALHWLDTGESSE